MKVEIEYSEIESLHNEINRLKKTIKEQSDKLSSMDERVINENIEKLAFIMFNSCMRCVFEKLGFNDEFQAIKYETDLNHYIGKNWWESDRIEVELGAVITTNFKRAFLNLGIKTD